MFERLAEIGMNSSAAKPWKMNDPRIKILILLALANPANQHGRVVSGSLTDSLTEALGDDQEVVREAALGAIDRLAHQTLIEEVIGKLGAIDNDVREDAWGIVKKWNKANRVWA